MTNPRERDRISVAKRLGRQAEVREPPDRRIGRTIAIRAIEASKIVAVPDWGSPDVKLPPKRLRPLDLIGHLGLGDAWTTWSAKKLGFQ